MYFNIVSFFGFFGFILVAWLFSSHRRVINLSLLLWGVLLQFVFGAVVFLLPAGRRFFSFLNDGVFSLLSHANEGVSFVFGRLALPPGAKRLIGRFSRFPSATCCGVFRSDRGVPLPHRIHADVDPLLFEAVYRFDACQRGGIVVCIEQHLCGRRIFADDPPLSLDHDTFGTLHYLDRRDGHHRIHSACAVCFVSTTKLPTDRRASDLRFDCLGSCGVDDLKAALARNRNTPNPRSRSQK